MSKPGAEVGETLTIRYKSPRHVAWVTLAHADEAERAKASRVTLSWEGGEQTFALTDTRAPQDLVIEGFSRMSELTLRIDEVRGPKGAGVAIGEILAYEPYEVISVKFRRRAKFTDAVEALRVEESAKPVKTVVALGERIIPWLVAELERGEALSGVRALQALQKIDRGRAWRVAYNALEKGAPKSAVVAAAYVASIGAKDLAEAVHGAYQRLDGEAKSKVLSSLAELADARALRLLVAGVRSGDVALTKVAGMHLAAYGEEALFEIIAMAGDPHPKIRERAVAVLIELGGASAVQALCDLANAPDEKAGLAVVVALGASKSPVAEAALVNLASEPAGPVRDAALSALIKRGSGALSALIAFGAQSGPAVDARVCDALGRSASLEVRDALVQAILSAEPGSSSAGLQSALAKQGKAGIEAVLKALITAPERAPAAEGFFIKTDTRSAGVLASALSGLSMGADLDPLRLLILRVLAHAQYVRAADAVADVYREKGSRLPVRIAAVQTAAQLPSATSKEIARHALASPEAELAKAGLEAAIGLRDEAAGEILIGRLQTLGTDDWPKTSIDALARLKTQSAIALFRKGMKGASPLRQIELLRAAKRIGGKGATRFLIETSMSGQAEVSRTASQLLRTR